MRLSEIEFQAMQSGWRRWGQRNFELPLFRAMGLDIRGQEVLEIGCGSGYGAFLLNHLNPKSYIGLDVMDEQIALARQNYPQYQFVVQDAIDLRGFADASKGIVVIFGALHHIPQWRRAIDEIARVLQGGGRLFLEEPQGLDVRRFDLFFRWGHPDSDFGWRALEEHLRLHEMRIIQKRWTPIMTMLHCLKAGDL